MQRDRDEPIHADESAAHSLLPSRIHLIDRAPQLVRQWQEAFGDCPEVEAVAGSYFQRSADAIVSPANSFGIMDGGLDLDLRGELGYTVENKLQEVIVIPSFQAIHEFHAALRML